MARKVPKLEDVARLAGVSTATVSRCLNAPEKVVKQTRERVLAAVNTLGYAPNFNAQALAARRTQTIGAIIPTMKNAIFAEGIQAFQEALQSEGFSLLIAFSSYDADLEAESIRNLVARGADGILVIGFDREPSVYQFLAAQNVPVLIAWAYDPQSEHVCIGFDSKTAMAGLVGEAIALGHKRIGMISARQSGNDRARARVAGVRFAMAKAGLGADDLAIEETDYGLRQAGDAFERLRTRMPEMTLLVGGNDVLAAGAIRRAAGLNIHIPSEISVIGFDDIAVAQLVSPGLTTVRVPHQGMGEAAAKALIAMVQGQSATSCALKTEVCHRESLARPKT